MNLSYVITLPRHKNWTDNRIDRLTSNPNFVIEIIVVSWIKELIGRDYSSKVFTIKLSLYISYSHYSTTIDQYSIVIVNIHLSFLSPQRFAWKYLYNNNTKIWLYKTLYESHENVNSVPSRQKRWIAWCYVHCEVGGTKGPEGSISVRGTWRIVHWLIRMDLNDLPFRNGLYIMLKSSYGVNQLFLIHYKAEIY